MKDEDLSNVPASVLKQQRAADRKIKEAQEGTPTPEDAAAAAAAPENIEDPPATPIEATPVAPIEAAPVAPAINDGSSDDAQWEQKYKVLQGKYNAEIPELQRQLTNLSGQLERQDTVIQGLNAQQPVNTPSNVNIDDLNPEDFQGWGDEMKTMVTTVNQLKTIISEQAQTIAGYTGQAPAAAAGDDGLQTRVESLESNANSSRITSYLKYLDDNIKGDWRAMNKNAQFNAWLAIVDPISMETRKAALGAAAEDLRGSQVASIFNLYITENGGDAGIIIANELPAGSGNGDETFTPAVETTQADVAQAQSDFVKGLISEEDFDKIYSQFQSTLRKQNAG